MKPTPQLDQGDLFMSKAPWFDVAQKYLGLKEIKGSKHAPLIVQMWSHIKLAGIKDDETPWCAAFVGSCLEEVGIQSTRSAASYRDWETDRKSTRLNSSHRSLSRMPSSA